MSALWSNPGPRQLSQLWLLATLLLPLPAVATPGGGSRAMFTQPLPDGDLADGTVTVKVVGRDMGDVRVGQKVTLQIRQGVDFIDKNTVSTGENGRARFDDLAAESTVRVKVIVDGAAHLSGTFAPPASGGYRLLLSLGDAAAKMQGTGQKPPKSGDLPPGHPPVPDTPAPQSDSGGAASVRPDLSMPDGQVEVSVVKGKKKTPVSAVQLDVSWGMQVVVEKGKPRAHPTQKKAFRTGEQGTVLVGPWPSNGGQHSVTVQYDGMVYRSGHLNPPKTGGLRVSFLVHDRTTDPSGLVLVKGTQLLAQVREDRVSFLQVLALANRNDTLFDPEDKGLLLPLPHNTSGVEVTGALRDLVTVDSAKRQIRFVAPVPPGKLDVRYFFEIKRENGGELDVRIRLPLAAEHLTVALLNSETEVDGPAVTGKTHEVFSLGTAKEKRPVYQLQGGASGSDLEFTLTKMPHRDHRVRNLVLGLSAVVVLFGLALAMRERGRTASRRAEVETMLDELATLEEKRRDHAEAANPRRQELLVRLRASWHGGDHGPG